jgi:DNA primase
MDFACRAARELTVSSGSSLDLKEQVRQAIDIVDLVGSVVQLRRQGRNYVGLCPWHDDTRPSLQVNPERQSFKCWVCDIGGDVFSFIMKTEGVEFREALEMLADRAGIALRPARSRSQSTPGGADDKRTLYQAMAWAEQQYHDCLLHAPEAEPARHYLAQRKITSESIGKFHLGFAPERRSWLLARGADTPYKAKTLETIGLVVRPSTGVGLYDRFKGRLLFPIRDTQGRPVGLGGRVLPQSGSTSPAKYVNTPETPLFSKSNLLYGLDLAREAVRRGGTALVMEGYTDVIAAHQYGFGNAVAVLGTALGEGHIRILNRFAERIVLVLDADEAGQRRANEVLELFVAEQADLQVLTLPEGTDPCDFLHEHGAEAFADLIENKAVDALNHAFRAATGGLDLEDDARDRRLVSRLDSDVHWADQALDRLLSIIAKAQDIGAREQKILQQLAGRFRVEEMTVRRRVQALRRRSRSRTEPRRAEEAPNAEAASQRPEKIEPTERELLELLIAHPECFPAGRSQIDPLWITAESSRRIYQTCCRLLDAGITPSFDRLMLEFDHPAIKSLLVELDEGGRAKGARDADPEALLGELIQTVQRKEAERQRPAQLVALREGRLDDSQETELLEKIIRQERSRQGISEPTDE